MILFCHLTHCGSLPLLTSDGDSHTRRGLLGRDARDHWRRAHVLLCSAAGDGQDPGDFLLLLDYLFVFVMMTAGGGQRTRREVGGCCEEAAKAADKWMTKEGPR